MIERFEPLTLFVILYISKYLLPVGFEHEILYIFINNNINGCYTTCDARITFNIFYSNVYFLLIKSMNYNKI